MTLSTRCPHCQTAFRVAADQLKLRGGLVRCGACKQVFNGVEHLLGDAGESLPVAASDGGVEALPVTPVNEEIQAGNGLELDFIPFSQDDPASVFPDDIPLPPDDGLETAGVSFTAGHAPDASASDGETAVAAAASGNDDAPPELSSGEGDESAGDAADDHATFDRASARADAEAAFAGEETVPAAEGDHVDASDPWPEFANQAAGAAAQLQAAWAGHRAKQGDDGNDGGESDGDGNGDGDRNEGDGERDPSISDPDPSGSKDYAAADHDQHAQVWRARQAASDVLADEAGWPLPLTSSAPQEDAEHPSAAAARTSGVDERTLDREPVHTADYTRDDADSDAGPAIDDPLLPPPGQTLWNEEPDFVQQARKRQRRRGLLRVAMIAGSVLLLAAGAAQATYFWRNQIAAAAPAAKPALARMCARLHCTLGPSGDIRQMSIESNELQAVTQGGNVYMLTLTLRNRSAAPQAWPSVELTLNDDNEQAVVKRVFAPGEYLPPALRASEAMPRESEQQVRVSYELQQAVASGYRVYLFYP